MVSVSHRELLAQIDKTNFKPLSHDTQLKLKQHILSKAPNHGNCPEFAASVTKVLITFGHNLFRRYVASSKKLALLNKKHSDWLDEDLQFGIPRPIQPQNVDTRGRKRVSFEESSPKTKNKKVRAIICQYSAAEIIHAAKVCLYKKGERKSQQQLLGKVRASRVRVTCKKKRSVYSPEEALDMMVRLKLSKLDYQILRNGAVSRGSNMYPAYNKVRLAKEHCTPLKESMVITPKTAEVKVQSLLDHTVSRIIETQREDIKQKMHLFDPNTLKLDCKWGVDGSSSQSNYKQLFGGEEPFDDSSVFISSMVPLQLSAQSLDGSSELVIWKNPRPSSVRFCRPIRFNFEKESETLTKDEVGAIEKQINELIPSSVPFDDVILKVRHEMHLTMIDGKVCSMLTDTGTQTCHICGATPKTMNLPVTGELREDSCKYGLSILHANIRFLDCILHIAYKLDVKKWKVMDVADKKLVQSRKKQIQKEFRIKTGLIIDQPKQGSGNSNDGNTARMFFADPVKAAEITGVDVDLITRFSVILRTISCGFPIDVEKFEAYCQETVKVYRRLYDWYYLPESVHKILMHGSIVIKSFLLPIGQFSEEASEARNKFFRYYREYNTRKISRVVTNYDLLRILLISSDPFISSKIPSSKKKRGPIPKDVLSLLRG